MYTRVPKGRKGAENRYIFCDYRALFCVIHSIVASYVFVQYQHSTGDYKLIVY